MSTTALPLLTVSDLGALPEDGQKYELISGGLYVCRALLIYITSLLSRI